MKNQLSITLVGDIYTTYRYKTLIDTHACLGFESKPSWTLQPGSDCLFLLWPYLNKWLFTAL